ncbi:hypothetical protein ACTFIZ_007613 [Dictyostelium cf. discoideum]
MKKYLIALAAITVLTTSSAFAQSAGSSIDTRASTSSTDGPLTVKNIGGRDVNIQIVCRWCTPKHKIVGTGTIGQYGQLGSAKQWSPSILVKYYFGEATSKFCPFVGLGINYTWFSDVKLTNQNFIYSKYGAGATSSVSANNSWNPVFNLGASYKISDPWYASRSVSYLPLKTKLKIDTISGKGFPFGTGVPVYSEAKANLNPIVIFANIGYRF